jgi:A/G-specific adenine glycosylase
VSNAQIREVLLIWYSKAKRDLPWRHQKNAYAIWVSEVMLQQTQVSRVLLYFEKFVARFPSVEALAACELSEVLNYWQGLGYYSRARNLHAAAKEITQRFQGRLPADLKALRSLPGFGRYTAGAVASIAFDIPAPIVDGNVARVLCRLFEIDLAPEDKSREKELWHLAGELVHGKSPGDFNQSMMELGATVCTPSKPLCERCPVAVFCRSKKSRRVHEIPPAMQRAQIKQVDLQLAYVKRKECILMARRKESGLFSGLWEMPTVEAASAAVAQPLWDAAFAGRLNIGRRVGSVIRTLTHRELRMVVYEATLQGALPVRLTDGYVQMKFVSIEELPALAMSAAHQAVLELAHPGGLNLELF